MVNAEILLTKNRVLEKMRALLEQVQAHMLQQAPTFSNAHIFQVPPKISRGENYRSLPYLVLDYPRVFQQTDVFAIRSFFWWGNFFSSTLHLSGLYKEQFAPKIEAVFPTFSNHHISINTDPWQHHFEQGNYAPVAQMEYGHFKKLLHGQAHVKLAVKLPVKEWQQAETFLYENWKAYLDVLL